MPLVPRLSLHRPLDSLDEIQENFEGQATQRARVPDEIQSKLQVPHIGLCSMGSGCPDRVDPQHQVQLTVQNSDPDSVKMVHGHLTQQGEGCSGARAQFWSGWHDLVHPEPVLRTRLFLKAPG